MVNTLVLTSFGRAQLGHTTKTNLITFQTVDPEICSTLNFHKSVWDQLLHHFVCDFSRKTFIILHSIS